MVVSQSRSKQTETGKPYIRFRKKRLFEKGSIPTLTKLGKKKIKTVRTIGNNTKSRYLQADHVNLFDSSDKKYYRVDINAILENKANANFVRRNMITKGTVIETEKGKAKITSRPGQDGTMNAILIK